jgi:hypothetical protein
MPVVQNRRTVGKMIELLAGKAGVLTGNLQYGVRCDFNSLDFYRDH